jgi:hypothetical protein
MTSKQKLLKGIPEIKSLPRQQSFCKSTMEASFIGNKQVDPRHLPESNIQKIPDEELNKREAERLKDGAKEPGANKAAGAASRNPRGVYTLLNKVFERVTTKPRL